MAELAAHAIHGAFGGGAPLAAAVDQVGRVGVLGVGQRADADAEQPIARAVDLALQQFARGAEDLAGELGRAFQRARPGEDAEVRGLELERDGRAGRAAFP